MKEGNVLRNKIVLILGVIFVASVYGALESEIILFESLGPDDYVIVSNRFNRLSKGVLGIDMNLTVVKDAGDECTVEIGLYYSALSNGQYLKSPIGASNGPLKLSEFMTKYYQRFLMSTLKSCSNLPQFTGNYIPPWKAGFYQAINCKVDDKDIPSFIREGSYKAEGIFKVKGQEKLFRFILKMTKSVG